MKDYKSLVAILIVFLSSDAFAQAASEPGEPTAPYPTLESISIDWPLTGDDNANGVVTMRYRLQGGQWNVGHPLMRVPAGSNAGFSWNNRHSGSLFGLQPGQTYDVELRLEDPDGGDTMRTLSVQTRSVPVIPENMITVRATPDTLSNILGDLQPGTLVELAAGEYAPLTAPRSGEEGSPIIFRSSDGQAVIQGDVRMDSQSHIWLDGLHVRGKVKFNNATDIVIQRLFVEAIEASGDGIISYGGGVERAYIANNVVVGQTSWNESALGVNGDNIGEGIAVTGPGNVIAYNSVTGFRDCISLLEDGGASRQFSIDIIGNDLDVCADDAIEADFAMGNVRVIGNRFRNSFIGLSSQPSLGGPTYFIRNVGFNTIFQVFKPNRSSVGDIWYHNTSIKNGDALGVYTDAEWLRATFKNNVLIGGGGTDSFNGFSIGSGQVYSLRSVSESQFDFNGLGMVGIDAFTGILGDASFDSLASLADAGFELNATLIDLDIFEAAIPFPDSPFPAKAIHDFRLKDGDAVDRGEILPNVNDGFAGAAPDLGATELGDTPMYGPRDEPVCGNSIVELGEFCDDGNAESGDGCFECAFDESDTNMVSDEEMGANNDTGMGDMGPSDTDTGNHPTDSDWDGSNSNETADGTSVDGSGGCRTTNVSTSAPWLLLLCALFGIRRRC